MKRVCLGMASGGGQNDLVDLGGSQNNPRHAIEQVNISAFRLGGAAGRCWSDRVGVGARVSPAGLSGPVLGRRL